MRRTLQHLRFARMSPVFLAVLALAAVGNQARAACPCAFSYTVEVEYFALAGTTSPLATATLTGSAQVVDSLDRDLGSIQTLLQGQITSSAILLRVNQVTLGTSSGAPANDGLLASDGDVILWVEAKDSPSARLHASTKSALDAQHAFAYTVTAKGTESPPVSFSFLIAAFGHESYPKPIHQENALVIAHFGANGRADCKELSGDFCLPPGCTRTASRLDENTSGGLLKNSFNNDGARCASYDIKVTSTASWSTLNCENTGTGCWNCGGWYNGTVLLDGTCPDKRPWARKTIGTGTATGPAGVTPQVDFLISYGQAGGVLGSGLPDAGALVDKTSYAAEILDCEVGGVTVSCNAVHSGMQADTLHVSTDFSRTLQTVSQGTGSLSAPQGIVFLGAFPFDPSNHDVHNVRYSLTVTFAGRTYTDLNDDGTVDVGPFSLWLDGDQLHGAFDRSSVPTAVIDSIAPNPALTSQPVNFVGHGTGGTISGYEWRTHRLDGVLNGAASFSRNDLVSGRHQISFRVFGVHTSAWVYKALTINQPPVAFINHVENTVDPAHPAVALLLHDGIPSDPFHFDGSGIDFDGSVVAYEWTSDRQAGILCSEPRFDASLTVLGTHKISLRVRDDMGAWSAPVTTTVTVRRPPVLLVHGFCGDADTWDHLIDDGLLKPQWQSGDIARPRFDPNHDHLTNDSPADIALLVAARIQDMKDNFGVRTVNVVVHSMGGLATRAYVQGPGFQGDVNKLVMLGTPNHGANIADLILIGQSYSEQDVELFIPIPAIKELLVTLGIIVDINLFNIGSLLECQATDSPAAHDLRPHSAFVHNLNRTFKDEGTEDFGASGEPAETISPYTQHFLIHGKGPTVSHTHLPTWLKNLISAVTGVNLAHMELAWVRPGDWTVTDASLELNGVPGMGFDRTHGGLHDSSDSVGQARDYLLDDPPAPPPGQPGLDQIEGAQLLGASQGSSLPSLQQNIEVDGAATRLRIGLSWEATNISTGATGVNLRLTSPSGVTYSTSSPLPGFDVVRGSASLEATITSPAPGTWTVQVVGEPGNALTYRWLAHQESGTFLAIGLSADRTDPGQPVKLAAYVQSGGAGATGATVYAAIAPPAGKPVSLLMVEDSRFPGLYVTDFTPQAEGTYNVLAAASLQGPNGGAPVTRSGITSFDARSLAELSITATLSNPAPQHGEPVRWFANVHNAGAAGAPATVVQFFDGLPAAGGRLLGTRTIDLPPGPAEVQTSILWLATAGEHRLVAVVDPMNHTEAADATRHAAEIQATAVDRTPPIARPGPNQVAVVGQNVVFDGRASTDDDRIVNYVWQFQGSGEPDSQSRAHSFTLVGPYVVLGGGFPFPGVYTVSLTVTDASGNATSAPLTVRVVEGFDTTAPIADAGAEIVTVVGAPVTFDGTRSQDDFGVARATWDVDVATDSDGDGNPANDQDLAGLSPTLEHGYSRPGLYHARLTVSDAAGNGPSTSDVLVRVIQPVGECTVTVPPGADINRTLAVARPGETVCLRPVHYQSTTITISTSGVTLDGQGAVLDGSALGEGGIGVLVGSPANAAKPTGVTVRNLIVDGCVIGFFAATGSGHHLSDNAVRNCQTGFDVEAQQSVLERNRVEHAGYGFLVYGSDNRLIDNSARGGNVGINVFGLRQRLEGNQACNNLTADLLIGPETAGVSASGAENACGIARSWSDEGHHGCTFSCSQIKIPLSGLFIDQDTLFEAGSYSLTTGLVVTGRNVHVRLAGTELLGPHGSEIPGIEIRDAPGASLTGGTIAGFGRGLLVVRSDGGQISNVDICHAEIGVDVASGARGQLTNVRVTSERLALRLSAAARDWTVDQSELAGEDGSSVLLAGSGHSLRHNHVVGGITLATGTTGSHLTDNVIVSSREGISLLSSRNVEIRANTVQANAAGILVRDSSAAQITGNVISGDRGILLDGGGGHQVSNNQVEALTAAIQLSGGRNARIVQNRLAARHGSAVLLELATGNEISRNDATLSRKGIDLHSSDGNRIHGNRCIASRLFPGITLSRSNGNAISRNVLTDLWPGGVLPLASNGNRIGSNELRASGAAPREIVTLGIGLVEQLRGSPGVPAGDLARGLSLAWENMRSFTGLERLNPRTGMRFFHRLDEALHTFQRLAAGAGVLREERDLLRLATAQISRGAELVAQRAIQDAQEAGADHALLEEAQRDLQQGIAYAETGRQSLATDSFGRAWVTVSTAAFSPARLSATMTVEGQFTKGGEITYHVKLTNAGPRSQRDNAGDEFVDQLPPTLQLMGVTASGGQARSDRGTGTAAWTGSIPPGGVVSLTIHATIRAGTIGQMIVNQGTVFFDVDGDGLNTASAPTDDPTLPGSADATVFTVSAQEPSPAEIPALSPVGWLILALLLVLASLRILRRSCRARP